jgi:hypothetical protein
MLLFTDGDVIHSPDSLTVALSYYVRDGVDVLSLWGTRSSDSSWEKLFSPFALFLLSIAFVTFASAKTPQGRRIRGVNGQYILISRKSYERIGGHESVKGSIAEDASLGAVAIDKGLEVVNVDARHFITVKPYSSLSQV